MGRRRVELEQILDRVDVVSRPAAPVHTNGQANAAEYIHDVQELECSAIHRLVELEVDRPHVVRIFSPQQLSAAASRRGALPLAGQGPLQPLLTPDPLHPLVVDAPALEPQPPVDQSPTPAHMAPGQLTDPPTQLLLLVDRQRYWPALRVAVLARQPAGTPLGDPEAILQNHHSPAATFRAQKFPSASSLSMALSSSA